MGDIVTLDSAPLSLGHRLATLARQARHEVVASYPAVADVTTLARWIDAAAGPRVTVRHVVPRGDVALSGLDVRLRAAALPAGLFVFDHHTALVLTDSAAEPVLLSDRGSVALLSAFFERVWADAPPVGAVGEHLTDQQATTVRLLADGHTDEAIAKRLGVSARTARRIVMRLMDRLGARGRFQAGVRAVEAGWLVRRPTTDRATPGRLGGL
jgi:DNA-binding CsgD family transcriptional regulator